MQKTSPSPIPRGRSVYTRSPNRAGLIGLTLHCTQPLPGRNAVNSSSRASRHGRTRQGEKSMKRKTTQLATSLLASLALIGPADAREEAGGFYITPSLSYFFFDQERNLDNDAAIGLGLGYELTRQWSVRLMGDWMELDQDRGRQDVKGRWWHGDLLYHWNLDDRWRPYALIGIGDFRTDPEDGRHDRSTTYNAGFGIKREVHERVDVRMEALGLYGQDDSHWDGALQIGFNYLFGVQSRPTEPEPPRDSDGDGVYDPDDRCPNTPAGTEVDA